MKIPVWLCCYWELLFEKVVYVETGTEGAIEVRLINISPNLQYEVYTTVVTKIFLGRIYNTGKW